MIVIELCKISQISLVCSLSQSFHQIYTATDEHVCSPNQFQSSRIISHIDSGTSGVCPLNYVDVCGHKFLSIHLSLVDIIVDSHNTPCKGSICDISGLRNLVDVWYVF